MQILHFKEFGNRIDQEHFRRKLQSKEFLRVKNLKNFHFALF